jgi:hypothetical protein
MVIEGGAARPRDIEKSNLAVQKPRDSRLVGGV